MFFCVCLGLMTRHPLVGHFVLPSKDRRKEIVVEEMIERNREDRGT